MVSRAERYPGVEGLYYKRPIQLSGFFRNIDPPPPHRPAGVLPLAFGAGVGVDTLAGWRWDGGQYCSSENARHCSELYICE
jgi:hypothetical protein